MTNIKVLIVEDETIVALDTKSALIKLGFKITDTVTNYDEAIRSIQETSPDIILMDIYLKNSKDGIETAKDIKKIKNIPVIYLSAYCDDETIARAIKTDPIAYLVKPFNRNELKSTIMLAIYKLQGEKEKIDELFFHKLSSNYYYTKEPHLKLYYKDQEIPLTQKEIMLMEILIHADGELVTFSNIEHYIWRDKAVSDSTLRTLLYRLRTKLDYKVIETIPTFGCKLIKNT
ncbi:MAG: response regulator [Halarcobacter sp.]